MCGIVGYIGDNQAAPILLRDWKSSNTAGMIPRASRSFRRTASAWQRQGQTARAQRADRGRQGGRRHARHGHTRWATHGAPSDVNSHPQTSEGGKFAVVHNGIIENYLYLKNHLMRRGVQFVSETDTEVVAQMLEYYDRGDILETIAKVISKVEGSYALGIISTEYPDRLFCVRKDSPLIIGVGAGENFIASDIPAILSHTRDIYRLKDNEIAVLTRDAVEFFNPDAEPVEKTIEHIEWETSRPRKRAATSTS